MRIWKVHLIKLMSKRARKLILTMILMRMRRIQKRPLWLAPTIVILMPTESRLERKEFVVPLELTRVPMIKHVQSYNFRQYLTICPAEIVRDKPSSTISNMDLRTRARALVFTSLVCQVQERRQLQWKSSEAWKASTNSPFNQLMPCN